MSMYISLKQRNLYKSIYIFRQLQWVYGSSHYRTLPFERLPLPTTRWRQISNAPPYHQVAHLITLNLHVYTRWRQISISRISARWMNLEHTSVLRLGTSVREPGLYYISIMPHHNSSSDMFFITSKT